MPYYRIPGVGMVHLNLGGKLRKNPPAPCAARIPNGSPIVGSTMRCCAISSFLCDWVLVDGKTCDAPLCEEHARAVGPDRHLCPTHMALQRESAPWLF